MLATLGGFLALLVGLLVLLLPLLASELSRARDAVWGAVVLLLGLVLVTSAERLTGAPMLAVLCGGLLIGRLGVEVGQARWRQLTDEERQRLWSWERWRTSLSQLGASLARLLQMATGMVTALGAWLKERRAARPTTKRWVRPEDAGTGSRKPAEATAATAAGAPAEPPPAEAPAPAFGATPIPSPEPTAKPTAEPMPETESEPEPESEESVVVSDFEAIDALLNRASPATPEPEPADGPEGRGEAG